MNGIGAFKQNLYFFKQSVKQFFVKNKKLYLLFLGVVVFCLICAIILMTQYASGISIINCSDKALIAFFSRTGTLGTFIFLRVINFVFLVALIVVCTMFRPLSFLVYLLLGYVLLVQFINGCIFVILFGLFGILYAVFAIFFGWILLSFVLFTLFIFLRSSNSCVNSCNRLAGFPIRKIVTLFLFGLFIVACQIILSVIFSPVIIIIV